MTESIESLNNLIQTHVPENPVNKCRLSTDGVCRTLDRYNVTHEIVEGSFCGHSVYQGDGTTVHWYIRVPSTELTDCSVEDGVIVDPTIEQFKQSKYDKDTVQSLVPDEFVPNRYVVLPTDNIYQAYSSTIRCVH